MTDEQKQKQREANRRYQKKYRDNMTDEQNFNKKVCSQAYLEGCNFINDSDNKNY